jgi:quinol monooxygenase YgiN
MVSFIVRMEFREEDRERVKEFLRLLTPASRSEPGCITYIPHLLEEGPPAILIYEQYADEAALTFHRSTPHFAQYGTDGLFKLTTSRKLERLEVVA